MATSKIKVGDTVRVIAGKSKGKEGKVTAVDHKNGKHNKPSMMNPNGGITQQEAPLDASNVMLVVDGQVTRVGFSVENGKKVRVAKKTGKVID